MGRVGFTLDMARCIGCSACQVACKEQHHLAAGEFFRRAGFAEQKIEGKAFCFPFSVACNHCENPVCAKVCPTGAMHRAADGTVQLDGAECINCRRCLKACPYGAISLNHRTGRVQKCDACAALRAAGEAPACVDACPVRALTFGEIPEGETCAEVRFLPDPAITGPSLILKNVRPLLRMPEKPAAKSEQPAERQLLPVQVPAQDAPQTAASAMDRCQTAASSDKAAHPCALPELWADCSALAAFFESFDAWKQAAKRNPALFRGISPEKNPEILRQEYDDLLRGTDADISIPLWASICVDEAGSLMDATTLSVLHLYQKFGYEPVDMEKNPPDYLGQLLRFACWLMAGAAECEITQTKNRTGAPAANPWLAALNPLLRDLIRPTALRVADGLKKYARSAVFLHAAGLMEYVAVAEAETQSTAGSVAPWAGLLSFSSGTASVAADRQIPFGLLFSDTAVPQPAVNLPADRPHEIMTAGQNNCGGCCSVRAMVQQGCLLSVASGRTIGEPPIKMCSRGYAYRTTFLSAGRLRYPMLRIGKRGEGKFRRISWAEAEDLITSEWRRITAAYGPGSRYVNYGAGNVGCLSPDNLVRRLLNLDGGYLAYYGTYSNLCADIVTPYIYGDKRSGNSVEDTLNSHLLILWGHNPMETRFGSQRDYYTVLAKECGTKIVVVDPRLSDSAAALADEWIALRPSTDGALADAMAYTIWSRGLQNQHFMDTYCLGFDRAHMPMGVPAELNYHDYLFGLQDGIVKDAVWGEKITGVPAETIERLAVEYATRKPANILQGLGCQRTGNGEQTTRGLAALACLTGNIGIPGGGAAGLGYLGEEHQPAYPVGQNPYPGAVSCFLWTDAIERGNEMTREEDRVQGMERLASPIKLIFSLGSNTLINQHSDINRTQKILSDTDKCEFIVTSDVFMTPSARWSDLVLPAASFLEADDFGVPWRAGHYLLSCQRVIDPLFDTQDEYHWLGEVAKRLGLWDTWSAGHTTEEDWLQTLYRDLQQWVDLPDYETFRRQGGASYHNAKPYVAYADQIRDPEHHPFPTPSGKIELVSQRLYELGDPEIPAGPSYAPCPEGPDDRDCLQFPLQLIGWHTKGRTHTVQDRTAVLREVEPQEVWIHPADAAARGILEGDQVLVFNDRGRTSLPAHVTERIVPGTAAIPQGAWIRWQPDGTDTSGSINVLTSPRGTPLGRGNPQHTNRVEIRKESGRTASEI